jgi:hypothetical protein
VVVGGGSDGDGAGGGGGGGGEVFYSICPKMKYSTRRLSLNTKQSITD